MKLDFDNLTIINARFFNDQVFYYKNLGNYIDIYTCREYSLIEKEGTTKRVQFGSVFGRGFIAQAHSNNCFIIAT